MNVFYLIIYQPYKIRIKKFKTRFVTVFKFNFCLPRIMKNRLLNISKINDIKQNKYDCTDLTEQNNIFRRKRRKERIKKITCIYNHKKQAVNSKLNLLCCKRKRHSVNSINVKKEVYKNKKNNYIIRIFYRKCAENYSERRKNTKNDFIQKQKLIRRKFVLHRQNRKQLRQHPRTDTFKYRYK